MTQATSATTYVLPQPQSGLEVDEVFVGRSASMRFEKELSAAVRQVSDIFNDGHDDRRPLGIARAVGRLRAVAVLHSLICGSSAPVKMAKRITRLCETLIGCSPVHGGFSPMRLKLDDIAVDGAMANAVCLAIVAMVAGETAGGPLFTNGHVEIDFRASADHLTITFRDVADEAPDRLAIGGRLLIGIVHAIRAQVVTRETPGLASIEISIPYAGSLLLRAVGNA